MLSEEQIGELYKYCERKRVIYYDIQIEIVDHMANAIEDKMKADPQLGFKQALEEVHASFGSFGLREIVQSKESYMRKHYSKMRKNLFWSYFTLPKIAFTAFVFVVFVTLERLIPIAYLPYTLLVMGAAFLYLMIKQEIVKRKLRKAQKKQLLMTNPQYFDFSFIYLILFFQFGSRGLNKGLFSIIDKEAITRIEYYAIVILLLVYIISSLVRLAMIQTVSDKAKEKYPAVFVQ